MQDATISTEGPGYWDAMHRMAVDHESEMLALSFIHWLKNNFFCPVCRTHMGIFMETFHPNSCIGQSITIDGVTVPKIFEWTVQLHNNVNRNKGKALRTLSEAYRRYRKKDPSEPCTLSCADAVGPSVPGFTIPSASSSSSPRDKHAAKESKPRKERLLIVRPRG